MYSFLIMPCMFYSMYRPYITDLHALHTNAFTVPLQ